MLYSALDGQTWFDLLNDTDGISDPRGGFVLSDDNDDGLTRVELPIGGDFVPYESLVGRLRKALTSDLLIFAYDWRLSNRTNARLLGEAITARWEFRTPPTADERITIIAHSMGGLIARYFLESSLNGAPRTRQLITVGTPHDGAPEMYAHMLGKTQPLTRLPAALKVIQRISGGETPGHLLGPEYQQRLSKKYASLIEMLPVYDFVRRGQRCIPWRTSLDGIELSDHGGVTALTLVDQFRSGLVPSVDLPHWLNCTRVRYDFFAALGTKTIVGFDLQNDDPLSNTDGDGTVPVVSALAGEGETPCALNGESETPCSPIDIRKRRVLTRHQIVVERPTNSHEHANPDRYDHQDLMRLESVRKATFKILSRSDRLSPAFRGVPVPLRNLHELGMKAGMRYGRPKPAVLAIAVLMLSGSEHEPALRYQYSKCKEGGTRCCVTGIEGVLRMPERNIDVDMISNYDYVELESADPSESARQSGGILVEPAASCTDRVRLATWNTMKLTEDHRQTNRHHAESQMLAWVERQDPRWRERVTEIELSITHSPCRLCTADLVTALTGRSSGQRGIGEVPALIRPKRATISWGQVYRSTAPGLSTTLEETAALEAAGWKIVPVTDPVRRFNRASEKPKA